MAINPRFNILVVSALSDKGIAISALRHGARGFLHKPFTDDQLVRALYDVTSQDET
jgi:two-component system, chemotaxis family, chemotaxis protein CheY